MRRILCDDGTLWVNIGDSYAGGGNSRGQKSPLSAMQASNKGATGQRAEHLKNMNPAAIGCKPKDLIGIPWMLAFALRTDGWYLRQDIIWHKPNPMPESVTDRCTKSHEYIFLLSKSTKYYFNHDVIKEPAISPPQTRDRSNEDSNITMPGGNNRFSYGVREYQKDGMRNKRDVWTIASEPSGFGHYAMYPQKLILTCILCGCPENGIVLDPFMGSGTTAIVALKNLRKYIGCEINPEYIKIAERRIKDEKGLFN